MFEIGMHEHVCEQLVDMEFGCQEEMESENIVEVDAPITEHQISQKCQYINYQQVFCNCRYAAHGCI